MENLTFKALKTLLGRPCNFQHGDSTFMDCTISGHPDSDLLRIYKNDKIVQSITPLSFFGLMMMGDTIKITYIA